MTEPPEFMKQQAGHGLEGIGPDDVVWVGEDGTLAEKKVQMIIKSVFGQKAALRFIVRAVINRHPVKNGSTTKDERIDSAMRALLGLSARRGPKLLDGDEEILSLIGDEYYLDFFTAGRKKRSLSEICRAILQKKLPDYQNLNSSEQDHKVRRLRRKFNYSKDQILVARSYENELPEGRAFRKNMTQTLRSMAALGIVKKNLAR